MTDVHPVSAWGGRPCHLDNPHGMGYFSLITSNTIGGDMLQECASCGGQVSSEAASCPHCGHPVGKPTDRPRSERTVTTQATGKTAKLNQLIAVVVLIFGVVVAVANQEGAIGPVMILVGLIWYLAARIYSWWQYG